MHCLFLRSIGGVSRPKTAEMKHGAFWETQAGRVLRNDLPDQPNVPPKRKGDVVSLIGQEIPRSRLVTPATSESIQLQESRESASSRPGTRHSRMSKRSDLHSSQEMAKTGSMFNESIEEEALAVGFHKAMGFNDGEEMSLGGNSAIGDGFGAQSKEEYSVHRNLHKLDTSDLEKMGTVGGRNAHRATMQMKRDTNERLRAGERPRDVDILGNPRKQPVRIPKGKRGDLVQDGSTIEKAQISLSTLSTISAWGASHKQEDEGVEKPQAKITTKKGGGRNIRDAAIHTFEVAPHLIDMGPMLLGKTYKRQLILTNIGEAPARFRIAAAAGMGGMVGNDSQSIATNASSQIQFREAAGIPKKSLENKVRAVGRPKQPIAAGMKAPLDIEITAGILGAFGGAVEIISEFEVITVEIIGQVVDTNNTEPP
mmetsp:Transcript_6165/g.8427  ORF Transcript_6165/g.8427 Transcript_6165/m.8427 type:complete len:426 (+) Transcript_6165:109-1386(+)